MRILYQGLLTLLLLFLLMLPNGYAVGKYWAKGDSLPNGRPWPLKYTVKVTARVIEEDSKYIYIYALENTARNSWPISSLQIDLRKKIQTHQFPTNDLTLSHTYNQHIEKLKEGASVTPIKISSPEGWDIGGNLIYNSAVWGNGGIMITNISPGSVLTGFALTATESPGMRDYEVSAETNIFDPDYSWPMERISFYEGSLEYIAEVSMASRSSGKTIAPVAPPEPFTVNAWIVRITTDAVEARKLKWIKTDKALRDIKRLIADLNTEDTAKMKGAVKKIEDYVQGAKSKGALTDEADALVRLNAQYLLHRLEKQEVAK